MIHSVLLVDDFAPWRHHVRSALQSKSDWQIVAEAADGPDAIAKALALRPDLILLDVGLPTVNGIEAARRILANAPTLRILFVSEHQSWDIAEAALCTGARGYVCKSDAGAELLRAMETVVRGRRFVAARLGGRVFDPTSKRHASRPRHHELTLYSSDALLLEAWTQIAERALKAGATFIVLVTDSHRDSLEQMLRGRGVEIDHAMREGRYIPLAVSDRLSQLMVGDRLDEARTREATTSLLLAAAKASAAAHPRVVACGEVAPILYKHGNTEAALRLEQLWDELSHTYDLDVYCGYVSNAQGGEETSDAFEAICAVHTASQIG